MRGHSIALIADSPQFRDAIYSGLSSTGLPILRSDLSEIRELTGTETDGILILALEQPSNLEDFQGFLYESFIQQFQMPILIVLGSTRISEGDFSPFQGIVTNLFHWPQDSESLASALRGGSEKKFPFVAESHQTIHDVIEQRLVRFTPSLIPLIDRIALTAMHDVTVLLTGETGTGKTYLARLLHDCSPRKKEPFVSVPCGAQPASLIESAFFGHVKGAFTGADRNSVGKFAVAGKGTILLDEIDTLPLETQASLLRVIETGEFEPIGSHEVQHAEARVIVASNWDLEKATQEKKFREDLFYRLNVMSFHLPPLRERPQDIAPLVRGMMARFNTRFKKTLLDLADEALEVLETFDWPGNIRQLENVVQQAVLMSSGDCLLPAHLPPLPIPRNEANGFRSSTEDSSRAQSRANSERNAILQALKKNNYSRSKAARALGISRVTLYKKMKKYDLEDIPLKPGST